MRKGKTFLAVVILFAGIFITCTQYRVVNSQKKIEALQEWQLLYESADRHKGALLEMKSIIKKAQINFNVLINISHLISEIPFHTEVLLDVAESASRAKNEEIDFNLLAELAIIKLSESKKVSDLAKYASSLSSDENLEQYNSRYVALKTSAEASSIEEAVEKVTGIIEKARQSAGEL